ncbi:DUF2851 family protein [Pedobacter nyackensis]|uniref:DUF2851 family protein n=1 Tax=Pedobacter nyackensis TaxID=475255 RepID=UPI002930ABC8|nr:DUF2851 family protein [Pedobacter nyackensis]
MNFNEDFLHFIWRFRLFNSARLICADGEELRVVNPGISNKHAGPDFSGAKLIIDKTTWIGHVEIHLKSSDWLLHGHQHDSFYDGVILHVVYQHDQPIRRTNGSIVPVLVLQGLFSDQLLVNYKELLTTVNYFPCEKHIGHLDSFIVNTFLSRLVVERLQQKSEEVFQKLNVNQGDWEQTFYCFIARNFGFKVNAVPFDLLTAILPQHILLKHKDSALQIEALLFGQAGFLEQEFLEAYPLELQAEYGFLKKKYHLKPMSRSLWKFLRMRPQNFPTVRLAQFSALILKSNQLFSKVLTAYTLSDLYVLFNELPVNEYWQTHYHFNKKTKEVVVQPGAASIDNVIINSVCLFLFCYGKYTDQPDLMDRALDFLEKLPAEHNEVVNQYRYAGVKIGNAFTSQGLLQLNKCYCNQKKCLNCAVGIKILRK